MYNERDPFNRFDLGKQKPPSGQDDDEKILLRGLGLITDPTDDPDNLVIGEPGSVLDGRRDQEEPVRPDLG